MAAALAPVSHDRLTRRWQADWSGPTRLELAIRPLFGWERGALILDDTVLSKAFATAIAGLAGVFSRQERTPRYGRSLGRVVGTKGTRGIPRGRRLWRTGGPSTSERALERRSHAGKRLRCRPDDVLFAAWSPSRRLLKRSRDDGWSWVCRLKTHRRVTGQPLRRSRRHPSGVEPGWLSGGRTVRMVSYGKQDDATQRLTLLAAEGRRWSRGRAPMADVIRVGQEHLGLRGGQVRSTRAQRQHLSCCRAAGGVLERERQDRHLSIYQLKRRLSFQGRSMALPALERLRAAA